MAQETEFQRGFKAGWDEALTVLKPSLAEWADDFEAAAQEVPRGIKSTVLMTRAEQIRKIVNTPL